MASYKPRGLKLPRAKPGLVPPPKPPVEDSPQEDGYWAELGPGTKQRLKLPTADEQPTRKSR